MQIKIVNNPEEGAKVAFSLMKEAYEAGAKVFGLATGSSPVQLYELLSQSDLDFSDRISINLDEYLGLAKDNPQSYHYFMQEHLFQYKPFAKSYLPDGQTPSIQEELAAYDKLIEDHPIDFQILGIGSNAHIGFNEPGTPFDQKTHLVDLAPSTIEANRRFFDSIDQVPKQALSMGLASILSAKQIVLLAYGEKKAKAIKDMVEGPISPDVPASILQKHDHVTLILDKEAASGLEQ